MLLWIWKARPFRLAPQVAPTHRCWLTARVGVTRVSASTCPGFELSGFRDDRSWLHITAQTHTPDPSLGRPLSAHLNQRRECSSLACLRLRINFADSARPNLERWFQVGGCAPVLGNPRVPVGGRRNTRSISYYPPPRVVGGLSYP